MASHTTHTITTRGPGHAALPCPLGTAVTARSGAFAVSAAMWFGGGVPLDALVRANTCAANVKHMGFVEWGSFLLGASLLGLAWTGRVGGRQQYRKLSAGACVWIV